MRVLSSLWTLSRPFNGLMVFICVYAGAYYANNNYHELLKIDIFLMGMISFLVTCAANIINDYFDLEIDKINRPHRPLPSRKILPETAFYFSIFLFFFSFYLTFFLENKVFHIIFVAIFISFYYTPFFKNRGIIKNLTIALNVSLAFFCGAMIAGNIQRVFLIAGYAFIISIYREIAKDIYDHEGDEKNHIATLPVLYGKQKAMMIGIFCLFLLFFFIIISFSIGQIDLISFILFNFVIVFPLIIVSFYLIKKNMRQKQVYMALKISKILMFTGLILFFLLKN